MAEFVVLRNLTAAPTAAPFDMAPSPRGLTEREAAAPEPQVEVLDLNHRGVREVAQDPTVVGIARRMPTTLIAPVEAREVSGVAPAADGPAWGIAAVGADTSARTGDGVVVAVLDTGIERNHPAFAGVQITERDFTGDGNGDRAGHGTHCAGTIFGRDVGGQRIGVARGVQRALIGKVLPDNRGGTSDMVFNGIQWAIQEGANVISMSLGFDFPGFVRKLEAQGFPIELATSVALEGYRGNLRMFDALMAMAAARDGFGGSPVIVAAAGNESRRNVDPRFEIAASLPAAAEGVISVAALRREAGGKFGVADFSNTFAQIAAPGQGILSAWLNGDTKELNGTSMACPHVAGVACLWWEELRQGRAVLPSARLVVTQMLATARTNLFTADLDIADRGAGSVTAPP
ncbi:MAG TPA: S8 family serine peptidase [Roseomonas sp.]|jgi:subtilisin family serine protease